jgi:cell division protein FtsI (penicillin-binding protein 3)
VKPVSTLERRQQRPTRAPQSRHLEKRTRTTRVQRKRPGILVTFRAGDTRRRLLVVFIGSVLVLASVIGRVVYLQTAGSDRLVAAGKAQRTTASILMAQRGTIFASDGGELALSVPSSTIMGDPKHISDPTGEAAVLASLLNLTPAKQQVLVAAFTDKTKDFVFIARQIDDSLAQSVMALNLAGVDVLREDKRTMPSGQVGRSLLGRTDIDGKGTAGLEMQYNSILTGTNGERVREHDNQGRSIPGSESVTQAPVPGNDLVLTLDRSLQFQVEQALVARVQKVKAKGGTVVVMDSHTGEIYAVANVQRDPKKPTDVNVTSANLAAVEAFEPGSVAKVFSLAATVDQGAANPDTTVDVPGKLVFNRGTKWESTISDAELHGTQTMSMREIMVRSSNIGTYLLAKNITSDSLAHYFDLFGFGHKTALDFPGETKGIIDPPSKWQGTEKVTVTFGYHYQASALQFTAAVNAVANGGVYVAPKMLKATIDASGDVKPTAASSVHRVIKLATAQQMVSMMKDVVCRGTATGAKIPGISVAGKTGTAYKVQSAGGYGAKGNRAYRASFVGFFPADAPKVTILVSIDEPDPTSQDRFGGTASAPLFAQIAADAIHELKITPIPGDTGCPAKKP